VEPWLKVNRLRCPVVERKVDSILTAVLGLHDAWENRHLSLLLLKGRDLLQRLTGLRQAPVLLQFAPVQRSPFPDETKRCPRLDCTDDHFTAELELPLQPLVLRMKVRWLVIVVEHTNDDPEEDRYRRHGSMLSASALWSTRMASVGVTPC